MKLREIKYYFSNDNLFQHYYEDERGLKQGEYKDWHRNGEKCYITNIKNNKVFGIGLRYKNNNDIIFPISFIKSKTY